MAFYNSYSNSARVGRDYYSQTPTASSFYNYHSNLGGTVLKQGSLSVIVYVGDNMVLKTARPSLDQNGNSGGPPHPKVTTLFNREQTIYSLLAGIPGVVRRATYWPSTTCLEYMPNSDLASYLARARQQNNPPSRALLLTWFRQLAATVAQIHARHILVPDLATRHCLLGSDPAVLKLCDFTQAISLQHVPSLSARNSGENSSNCTATAAATFEAITTPRGFSLQTDIGRLGAVMYEAIMARPVSFGFVWGSFERVVGDVGDPTWPRRALLPSTRGVWMAAVIERCWTKGGFRNVAAVEQALWAVEWTLWTHGEEAAGRWGLG